jgi:hypothetical protein
MEDWMANFIQEMANSVNCIKYLNAIKAMIPLYTDDHDEAIRRFNIMKNVSIDEMLVMTFDNTIEDGSYYVFITKVDQQN